MSAIDLAAQLIRKHEGLRLTVYDDATGKEIGPGYTLEGHPTIGYGRCLDRRGIDLAEANEMLRTDLDAASWLAMDVTNAWNDLNAARRAVLIDMAHNLGGQGLLGFSKFRQALDRKAYDTAAAEMLDSKWARQVGARAVTLAEIMRTGEMPEELVA